MVLPTVEVLNSSNLELLENFKRHKKLFKGSKVLGVKYFEELLQITTLCDDLVLLYSEILLFYVKYILNAEYFFSPSLQLKRKYWRISRSTNFF